MNEHLGALRTGCDRFAAAVADADPSGVAGSGNGSLATAVVDWLVVD